MKIAICDDCLEDIRYLENLIVSNDLCPANLNFYEYSSGEELLNSYMDFDAVFLDMCMEGMNGTLTAENIRRRDSKVILSFYSGFEVSASHVLKSQPYCYLMKNSKETELASDINMILKEVIRKEELPRLPIIWDGKVFLLELPSILYISIYNKGTTIWITGERAEEIWGEGKSPNEPSIKSVTKLEDYYQELKDYGFVYANKSYIVNSENVVAKFKDSVKLKGGCELTISRSRKKEFDIGFSQYWGIKYNREKGKG